MGLNYIVPLLRKIRERGEKKERISLPYLSSTLVCKRLGLIPYKSPLLCYRFGPGNSSQLLGNDLVIRFKKEEYMAALRSYHFSRSGSGGAFEWRPFFINLP